MNVPRKPPRVEYGTWHLRRLWRLKHDEMQIPDDFDRRLWTRLSSLTISQQITVSTTGSGPRWPNYIASP